VANDVRVRLCLFLKKSFKIWRLFKNKVNLKSKNGCHTL